MTRGAEGCSTRSSEQTPTIVESYLAGLTGATRTALITLRKEIPTFLANGPLVAYTGYETRRGSYLKSQDVIGAHREDL
jgi:hypothetical protein